MATPLACIPHIPTSVCFRPNANNETWLFEALLLLIMGSLILLVAL
jgi:hypothetical protein